MATTKTASSPHQTTMPSPKEQYLREYEREHGVTMKVLRAYPADKLELRPSPKCKTARELAWTFVAERGFGTKALNNDFAKSGPAATPPSPPQNWNDLLNAVEKAHKDFGQLVHSLSDDKMVETVKFFTGPKQLSDVRRIDICWFLLSDEIHHRGQFSVYLRMADGKVPSIYGPSADEPWM
jgi:uncharacterized damage-inducible protein DinB